MRVVDLFCGCGGMSLGFAQAGYEIVAAYDKWHEAIEIYRKNFAHPAFEVDLADERHIPHITKHHPEMMIGGPPCQDFSSAGKRDENLGRADLTVTFAEIVSMIKPQWVIMENVARIRKSAVLQEAKAIFREAGYGLTEIVLNAALCGVPQNRKRYFLIGQRDGVDNALLPYLKANLAEKPMTVHDYLGDSLGIEYYYRHPRSYQRRAIFSIYEPSPTVRGVNRPVPSTYQRHPGDAGDVDDKLRPLTTIERSYLQTFPDTFIFEGTKTNLEQMIGNAVPVKQATYVAKCIQRYVVDVQNNQFLAGEPTQLSLF